jgi:hypothetical protein
MANPGLSQFGSQTLFTRGSLLLAKTRPFRRLIRAASPISFLVLVFLFFRNISNTYASSF